MEEKDRYIDMALVDFKRSCEESDLALKNKNHKGKIPLEIFENLYAYVTFNKQQDVDQIMIDQNEELYWYRIKWYMCCCF